MELPKVSVVTITYGHEKYITDTLDGVLMQQYDGPVEFIIANDNSPDATDEVVKKYFLENPVPSNFEIKYTKHETNKGMMPNFIWALEQATGKYIALCEGDDYWTDPLKLHKQVDFLAKSKSMAMCFHGAEVLKKDGYIKSYYKHKRFIHGRLVDLVDFFEAGAASFATASLVMKSDVVHELIRINPGYFAISPVGDLPLMLHLSSHGNVGYISDCMTVYRSMHEESWSNNNNFEKSLVHYKKILQVIKYYNSHTSHEYIRYTSVLKKNVNSEIVNLYIVNKGACVSLVKLLRFTPRLGMKFSLKVFKSWFFNNFIK